MSLERRIGTASACKWGHVAFVVSGWEAYGRSLESKKRRFVKVTTRMAILEKKDAELEFQAPPGLDIRKPAAPSARNYSVCSVTHKTKQVKMEVTIKPRSGPGDILTMPKSINDTGARLAGVGGSIDWEKQAPRPSVGACSGRPNTGQAVVGALVQRVTLLHCLALLT